MVALWYGSDMACLESAAGVLTDRELQERTLRDLLRTGAFRFADDDTPWFPYTSGQIGPYYVQSTAVERDGAAYAAAIRALARLSAAAPAFDAISGGETRDWDFSNPVAVALEKPHLKLYKDGRRLGADVAGRAFLHVADLNNEGSSVRDAWLPAVTRNGGRLVGVLSLVDRLEDGVGELRRLGLPILSVVPLDARAWGLARAAGAVSETLYAQLLDRLSDRQGWAERTLLAHPDFFRQFHRAPATRDKARKILHAYPRAARDLQRLVSDDD